MTQILKYAMNDDVKETKVKRSSILCCHYSEPLMTAVAVMIITDTPKNVMLN